MKMEDLSDRSDRSEGREKFWRSDRRFTEKKTLLGYWIVEQGGNVLRVPRRYVFFLTHTCQVRIKRWAEGNKRKKSIRGLPRIVSFYSPKRSAFNCFIPDWLLKERLLVLFLAFTAFFQLFWLNCQVLAKRISWTQANFFQLQLCFLFFSSFCHTTLSPRCQLPPKQAFPPAHRTLLAIAPNRPWRKVFIQGNFKNLCFSFDED